LAEIDRADSFGGFRLDVEDFDQRVGTCNADCAEPLAFAQVKVFNDAFAFGAGNWTLNADVNGTPVTLLSAAAVNTGDIIILSFSATVTVASGAELVVTTSGQDTAGLDDDLGTVSDRFGATSSPSFGAGAHTLSTPFCAVSYTIAMV
jgi:hypothetical protein